jgi:hypothetical protein
MEGEKRMSVPALSVIEVPQDPRAHEYKRNCIAQVALTNANLTKAIERAFYAAVHLYRAEGFTEPTTYHKALEALNNAVKPYNEAYAP